jgi:hypothetical protein
MYRVLMRSGMVGGVLSEDGEFRKNRVTDGFYRAPESGEGQQHTRLYCPQCNSCEECRIDFQMATHDLDTIS